MRTVCWLFHTALTMEINAIAIAFTISGGGMPLIAKNFELLTCIQEGLTWRLHLIELEMKFI